MVNDASLLPRHLLARTRGTAPAEVSSSAAHLCVANNAIQAPVYRASPVALSAAGLSNDVLVPAWPTPPSALCPAFHFRWQATAEWATKLRCWPLLHISMHGGFNGDAVHVQAELYGISPLHRCPRATRVLGVSSRLLDSLGQTHLAGRMTVPPAQS